jgi:amidase
MTGPVPASVAVQPGMVSTIDVRLAKIAEHRSYNAWTNVDEARARRQAAEAVPGMLAGRIVAVKDNIDLSWLPTAAGVRALRDRQPTMNATVADRLLSAGAVIPGHTNMDTWARGVRTVSELWGSTANALNPQFGPMGSSGGSAVAVALGDADLALGTDTCGSIRYPAMANGVLGLRPTAGLVSRAGVVPLSPTQDVVGLIATTPQMLAVGLDVIGGPDVRDPLTMSAPIVDRPTTVDFIYESRTSGRVWRVGVINSLGAFQRDINGITMLDRLRKSGIELVDVKLPALPSTNVINDEFPAVKKLVLAGKPEGSWLSEPLVVADRKGYTARLGQRKALAGQLIRTLTTNRLDALVYPTSPNGPALRAARQPSGNCFLSASSGLPALAVPHGLNADGVSVPGIDLLTRPLDERVLLAISAQLTNVTG